MLQVYFWDTLYISTAKVVEKYWETCRGLHGNSRRRTGLFVRRPKLKSLFVSLIKGKDRFSIELLHVYKKSDCKSYP